MKYHRFVLCLNKFNEYVEKIPAKINKLDDTIRQVGSYEFVLTSDLKDSFWQRHMAKDKLPFLAFHSPHKGTYIFLRSSQGLVNQSEGLEEMLSVVLQKMGEARDHKNLIVVGPIMPGNVIIVLTIIFTEIYLGFKASIGVSYYEI